MPIQRRTVRATLALCAFAAGCGSEDATGPDADARFDAQRLTADVVATERAMRPPIWTSFAALGEQFELGTTATAAIAGSRELLRTSDGLTLTRSKQVALATVERLMSITGTDVAPSSPAIRAEALGRTYIYDATLGRYVVAPERTGAPTGGVRFILYAVNPVTGEPIVATEIGYADLIDEGRSRPTGIGLRLMVVSGGMTYLDYRVAIDGSPNSGTLAVAGFLTDGTTRLDFDIDVSATARPGSGTMNVAFEFAVPARSFTVVGSVDASQSSSGEVGSVNLVVRSGPAKIELAVTGDDHTVNATILVNDRIFATITGDHHEPVVRGAGGRELTQEEVQALEGIFRLVGGVFELTGNLLKPVAAILMLSAVT
jgi:hypothetical protein